MSANLTVRGYLVVRGNGSMRVVKSRPNLHLDEVAFPINVSIPHTWGRIHHAPAIELTLPPPPQPTIRVGEPEMAEGGEPCG